MAAAVVRMPVGILRLFSLKHKRSSFGCLNQPRYQSVRQSSSPGNPGHSPRIPNDSEVTVPVGRKLAEEEMRIRAKELKLDISQDEIEEIVAKVRVC